MLSGLISQSHLAFSHQESDRDWIPDPNDSFCGGHYKMPQLSTPANLNLEAAAPIHLEADSFNYSLLGVSTLIGNVKISQGDRSLIAPSATVNSDKDNQILESIEAIGPVEYADPLYRIWGERVFWDSHNEILNMYNAVFHYYPHHGRGRAGFIHHGKDGLVTLKKAEYTTCPPGSNTWSLKAHRLALDPENGRGQASHLTLKMKDIPVFYLPYFDFPLDKRRKTGWLYPSFSSTTESGMAFHFPFYWNIRPNIDTTITPTVLTQRGTMFATETRYLNPKSDGILNLHWLPNDRKYREFRQINQSMPPTYAETDPRLTGLEGGNHRFATNYKHHSLFTPRLVGNIDYSYVSDDSYFLDLGNDLDTASTTDLLQQGEVLYYGENWQHTLRVQSYQSLHPLFGPENDAEYERLPQWAFSASYPEVWRQLQIDANGEWVNYYHTKDPFLGTPITDGNRFQLRPAVSWPYTTLSGYITPRIQLDMLHYNLKLSPEDRARETPENARRSIPMYDLKAGLFLDRFTHFLNEDFLQTLEPKLYYLYVPYRKQNIYPNFDSNINTFNFSQIFRDNRFSGRDRLSDANQLTLSMTSRLLVKETGEERFNASLGEIFYFGSRNVSICNQSIFSPQCRLLEDPTADNHQSALIGQVAMNFRPLKAWAFIEWDPKDQNIQQSSYNLQWLHNSGGQINLGYYWVREDIATVNYDLNTIQNLEQTDLSFIWPVTTHFEALSRWQYDIIENRTINLLAGVAYHGCCFSWQIAASRYLKPQINEVSNEYRNGIFLTLAFRGLSSVGTKESQFDKAIPGYQNLEQRNPWKFGNSIN